MNRKRVAAELLKLARELVAEPWLGLQDSVDVGLRNVQSLPSFVGFAPRLAKNVKDQVEASLRKSGLDPIRSGFQREWSEYLTYVSADENSNKYHYYAIYSYREANMPKRLFVGVNCSGRIGIMERIYDLTEKFLGGPADSIREAQMAVNRHLSTKLRKGYRPTDMSR